MRPVIRTAPILSISFLFLVTGCVFFPDSSTGSDAGDSGLRDVQDDTTAWDLAGPDAADPFCKFRVDGRHCDGSETVTCTDHSETSREPCLQGCNGTTGDCNPLDCGALTDLPSCNEDETNRCAWYSGIELCLPRQMDEDPLYKCNDNTSSILCEQAYDCRWFDCVNKCLLPFDDEDVCPPSG